MKPRIDGSLVWSVVLGLGTVGFLYTASGFNASLRFTPYLAGFGTLAMLVILLAGHFRPEILRWTETTLQDLWGGGAVGDGNKDLSDGEEASPWPAIVRSMSYAVGFLVLVFVFGFPIVTPLYIALYLIVEARARAIWAIPVALGVTTSLVTAMVLLRVEVWAGMIPEIIEGYLGGSIIPPL